MTDTRKAQLEVGVDSAPAEQGFERIERKSREMAKGVAAAADSASKGLDGIGSNADNSAKKLDKATSSIIASVQRTTAAMQAGEKGTTKYFEALATQRGANLDVLQPYLAQLKEVESAQTRVGVSAAQTAAAMRGVPAQFTDIITSLQGGQAPMTVLLQQGGQLKDMFGGVGNAARALGGYVAGLVNPLTVAAAAVGTLAFAAVQGRKEAEAYNRALILSGNSVGTTADQMQLMAASMSKVSGTQGAAAEALTTFVKTAGVGRSSLEEFTASTLRFSQATGQSVESVAKQFAELAKDPLGATLKLNEGTNYLTDSVYKQIKALTDQGKTTQAAAVAQKALSDANDSMTKAMSANLHPLERGWNSLTGAIKGAWDAIVGLTRVVGPEAQLQALQKTIDASVKKRASIGDDSAFAPALDKELVKLREQESVLQSQVREIRKGVNLQAEQAERVKARAEADKDGLKYLSEKQRMERDIAQQRETLLRAGASEVEIEQRVAQIRQSYAQKHLGGENEVAGIRAKIDATKEYIARLGDLTLVQPKLTEAEQQVLKIQRELQGSIDGVSRAQKEKALEQAKSLVLYETTAQGLERWRTQYDQMVKALDQSADSIDQQARSQEAANSVYGKGTTAVQAYTLAVLKNQMAEAQGSDSFTPQYIASLQKKIDAQTRYVAALNAADYKTLNAGLDEWLRSSVEAERIYANEAQLAGLSSLERAKIVAQRQVELRLAKEISLIDQSTLTDIDKEALRQKARDTAARATSAAQAKAVQDEWTKVSDQISQSLTDSLMRGFEAGKGFVQNLVDTIKNLFNTMVLRPVIQYVVGGGLSALGLTGAGSAVAGQGGLGGGASALSGLSSASGLFGGLGLFGAGAKAGFSALFGEAGFGGAMSAGSTAIGAGNIAGGLGTFAGALAPVLAGLLVGQGISGKYSAFGSNSNTAVLGGTAIGALLGGPLGAALGGAVGGLVNRAFGMGPKELTAQGISGTFSGSGAAVRNYTSWKQDGGWFRSDRSGTDYSAVSADFKSALDKSLAAISTSSKAYADVIGLSASSIDGFTQSINISLKGLDAAGQQKAIQDALGNFGEELAKAALGAAGAAFVKDGEASATALQRLSTSLVGVNAVMDTLSHASLKASLAGADAASKLVDLFGSMQDFTNATSAYYQAYYSEQERMNKSAEQLAKSIGSLGLSMPATLAGFRALVDAQDLTTEAGRKTYAALIALSPAFADLTNSSTAAIKSLQSDLASFFDGIKNSVSSARDSVAQSIQELRSSAQAITPATLRQAITAALPTAVNYTPVQAAADAQSAATKATADALARLTGAQSLQGGAKASSLAADSVLAQAQKMVADNRSQYASNLSEYGWKSVSWSYNARLDAWNNLSAMSQLDAALPALLQTLADAATKADAAHNALSAANDELARQNTAYAQYVELQKKATAAAQSAGTAYAEQIRQYVLDASKSVAKLSDLRAQTVAYYQAQKALADGMLASANNLQQAAYNVRMSQLTPDQSLAEQRRVFDQNYVLALSTTGADKAAYADKLTQSLPALADAMKATATSRADWVRNTAALYAQADTVAKQLVDSAPKTYQQESIDLLGQIDKSLEAIGNASASAEKIISDAIYATGSSNIAGLRAIVATLKGETAAGFAAGGYTGPGGVNQVAGLVHKGEVVWSQSDVARAGGVDAVQALRAGSVPMAIVNSTPQSTDQSQAYAALVDEVRALRSELVGLRAEAQSAAISGDKTARILDRVTQGNDALMVATA